MQWRRGLTMKDQILLLVLVLAFGQIQGASRDRNNKQYRVVCYWSSGSSYGGTEGKFEAEDINPHICTHLNYAFATLNGNKVALGDPKLDPDMIGRFNKLRHVNPNLTTLISVGGWGDGSTNYSKMVSSKQNRQEFVASALEFVKKYDFDGLDLDWEYPAFKGEHGDDRVLGRAEDRHDFVELLKELRHAFQPGGYILTAAIGTGKEQLDHAYDVAEISKVLDFVNYMTYDFHDDWDGKVGHNAPLHPDPGQDAQATVEFAVDYWLKKGGDPRKLVLGMPLYGKGFVLAKGANEHVGSRADSNLGIEIGFNELCLMIKHGWRTQRQAKQRVPYMWYSSQWIGFDDPESIKEKVNFLKTKGLGGGMVWSVESDDYRGLCQQGKYPLIKTISKLLNDVDGPDVPIRSLGDLPHDRFNCTKPGFFANPKEPTKFHQCVLIVSGHYHSYVFKCPRGTHYDAGKSQCADD